MRVLTEMSNNRQTQVVCAFFMVVLTIVWFFHRRGLVVLAPAVLILAAYEIEHQLQHMLKVLAHRSGPVPAGLGAFPSGGCARIISVYGLILYLVLRRFGKTRGKVAIAAWTLLAAASFTEAYSRLYLGKHWLTDIIGGVVFGIILLFVLIAAAQMLDRPDREGEVAEVVAIRGTSAAAESRHVEAASEDSPAADARAGAERFRTALARLNCSSIQRVGLSPGALDAVRGGRVALAAWRGDTPGLATATRECTPFGAETAASFGLDADAG